MTHSFSMADGSRREVQLHHVFNAGFTGRDQEQVSKHVEELAELGVRPPAMVPTLYPLPSYLATQAREIEVPHDRTSGEGEWAIVVGDNLDDVLLTVASDHTDRDLEVHGIAWSKMTSPNVLGDIAWDLAAVADRIDDFALRTWVRHGASESLIQDSTLAALLTPSYWLERLRDEQLLHPGTVLLGGTVAMHPDVDQFGDGWRVELADPHGGASTVDYRYQRLPTAWA